MDVSFRFPVEKRYQVREELSPDHQGDGYSWLVWKVYVLLTIFTRALW